VSLAPEERYHSLTPSPTPTRPERRSVSRKTVLDAAKAEVSVMDLMERKASGKIRRVGAEVVTNCVLPDHEDRVPSFTVNPEKNVWWCHGCLRGGDVIELARFLWGYEKHEVAMAAADLLHEFGHPIPERPASWYAKQKRQKPIRNAIEEAKVRHTQRRVFRTFTPLIEAIGDEEERRAETEYLWDAAGEIAVLIVAGSSG
jgi:DNA primase